MVPPPEGTVGRPRGGRTALSLEAGSGTIGSATPTHPTKASMSIEIGMTGPVVQRETRYVTVDGNDAAATVAHRLNEVIAIYRSPPVRRQTGRFRSTGSERSAASRRRW